MRLPYRRVARAFALIIGAILFALTRSLLADAPATSSGPPSNAPTYTARTAGDPGVPLDQLSLMVKPLTKDELVSEANE